MKTQAVLLAVPKGCPRPRNSSWKPPKYPRPHWSGGLLKTLFISVAPYRRSRVSAVKSYIAPFDMGPPIAGGTVGPVVGQPAKIQGCRVIDTAGTDEEVAHLQALGFGETIKYKPTPDIAQALATPEVNGVDCYSGNVGGAIIDAVYDPLNRHARIAICGPIST